MLVALLLHALALGDDAVLHTYHPRTWYSDLLAGGAALSPDGRYLVYSSEGRPFLLEVESGESELVAQRIGWDAVGWTRWEGAGARLLVVGREGGQASDACIDLDGGARGPSGLWPRIQDVACTSVPGRRIVAARHEGTPGIFLEDGVHSPVRKLMDGSAKLAWAVAPEADRLAVLRANEAGWADLLVVDLATGERNVLLEDLDASYQPTTMAWWRDEVVLSLVGPTHGTPGDKQDPTAERDLDLFAVRASGERAGEIRALVEGPGDDLVGGVVRDRLVWTRVTTSMRVALVPLAGGTSGAVREIVGETASFPSWHPDGKRLSAMYGPMTLADWALNWDLGCVTLDENDRPAGPLQPLVVGPHEDFGLAWSPDGRWMAYHSHRSPGPAMAYLGGGATDDIWLRPADGGPETRLTHDVGIEVCQPDWSPDGFELVFVAVDPATGRYRPVVVAIDPETGTALDQRDFRVPGIDGDVIAATYSPTAPEMALQERTHDGRHRLWLVQIESREKRLLTEFESLPELGGIDFDPTGESVVYTALSGGHHQLWRIATDAAATPRRLTDAQEELFVPQVSPDGAHVAVTVYTHTKTVLARSLE